MRSSSGPLTSTTLTRMATSPKRYGSVWGAEGSLSACSTPPTSFLVPLTALTSRFLSLSKDRAPSPPSGGTAAWNSNSPLPGSRAWIPGCAECGACVPLTTHPHPLQQGPRSLFLTARSCGRRAWRSWGPGSGSWPRFPAIKGGQCGPLRKGVSRPTVQFRLAQTLFYVC